MDPDGHVQVVGLRENGLVANETKKLACVGCQSSIGGGAHALTWGMGGTERVRSQSAGQNAEKKGKSAGGVEEGGPPELTQILDSDSRV